jgi:hypothetical protein
MPYICGKCYKTKGGAGGRRHRGHGGRRAAPKKSGGAKGRTRYQKCLSKQMKKIKASSFEMKSQMAHNACGKYAKKKK